MASLYDWLLVIAIMMVASTPIVAISNTAVSSGNRWYQVGLVAVAAVFFILFWSKGGQTLGMRAWRLKLTDKQDRDVTPGRAILRFACATVSLLALGLGFFRVALSRDGLSWHDQWSGTRLHLLPKEPRRKSQSVRSY
jgi:uncharacterized RDD family membrane protein YckC